MTSDMADTWDAEAEGFDNEPDHGLLDPEVREAWSDLLREYVPGGSRVLDLGCGTGTLAVLLAEQGHVVTGVDLSPRMLEAAKGKAARHGTTVTFVLGDASEPPVAGPFDVVLARHVVWALTDPAEALDRWLSLLPGHGRLVLIEGLWGNGAGIPAAALQDLVQPKVSRCEVRHLPEETFWGRPISDERYVLTASV